MFLLPLLAQLPVPALASDEVTLTPHVAEYKVKISILGGKLRTELSANESGYTANSSLHASGLASVFVRGDVIESSTFAVGEDGVRPLKFNSTDRISKKDKSMDFDFDWDNNTVSGKINDVDFTMDLEDHVYDRVSIQYELMLDLMNDNPSDEYSLLDDDELKFLQVSNIGTKQIKVPFGKFEAIGIQHRKKNSTRITTLWCVEDLGYLPAIIEQHRDGKLAVRAVLTSYQPTVSTAASVGPVE